MKRAIAALAMALAACAAQTPPPEISDSVVPGTIGVTVREQGGGVVVTAVAKTAESAGLRAGDVVESYNGEAVTSARQFYRLVVDSPPGSVARLGIQRASARHLVEVPVRQLDLMPRAGARALPAPAAACPAAPPTA